MSAEQESRDNITQRAEATCQEVRDVAHRDANKEKAAGTLENVARRDNLHWDVFVTPGIPIVTRDKPPGVRETLFQATASTLIYGVRDAVLVDAFMTVKQANALADWVAARGKTLTTIYITHGHGDHWFGVGTLLAHPAPLSAQPEA